MLRAFAAATSIFLIGGFLSGCSAPSQPSQFSGAHRQQPAPAPMISNVHMIDQNVGWALDGTLQKVLRTADGGLTWVDVSPSQPLPEGARVAVTFVSGEMAVQAVSQFRSDASPGKITVWLTANGGQSWEKASLDSPNREDGNLARARFSDPRHGGLVIEPSSMFGNVRGLFHTEDGGRTWTQVSEQRGCSFPISVVLGVQGVDTLWGSDPHAGGLPAKDAALFSSQDQGCTWKRAPLPVPEEYRNGTVYLGDMQWFTKVDGALPISFSLNQPSASRSFAVLVTHDGGRTWVLTKPLRSADLSWGPAAFADDRHAWVAAFDSHATVLYKTSDGAQTWHRFAPEALVGFSVTRLRFVTPQVGFAEGQSSQLGASSPVLLWRTTDGGETWTELKPKLKK